MENVSIWPKIGKLVYIPLPATPPVQYRNAGNDSTTKHVTETKMTSVINRGILPILLDRQIYNIFLTMDGNNGITLALC